MVRYLAESAIEHPAGVIGLSVKAEEAKAKRAKEKSEREDGHA